MRILAHILGGIILLFSPVIVTGQTVVTMADTSVIIGEQVSIPVYLHLEDGDELSGLFTSFAYDTTYLSFVRIDDSSGIADSTVNAINPTEGSILFSMASTYPVDTSGLLFNLVFVGKEIGTTTVDMKQYRFNENETVSPGPSSEVKVFMEGGNQPPFIVELPDTLFIPLMDTLTFTLDESLIADFEDAFEDLKFSFTLDPEVILVLVDEVNYQVKFFSLDYTGYATLTIFVEDTDGAILEASIVLDIRGGVANEFESDENPLRFDLSQNYPNPFNPTSNIQFSIPEASLVKLHVFNMLGQKVASLVDRKMDAGTHVIQFNGDELTSGMYLYRIQAGDFISTKRMMLIK